MHVLGGVGAGALVLWALGLVVLHADRRAIDPGILELYAGLPFFALLAVVGLSVLHQERRTAGLLREQRRRRERAGGPPTDARRPASAGAGATPASPRGRAAATPPPGSS